MNRACLLLSIAGLCAAPTHGAEAAEGWTIPTAMEALEAYDAGEDDAALHWLALEVPRSWGDADRATQLRRGLEGVLASSEASPSKRCAYGPSPT